LLPNYCEGGGAIRLRVSGALTVDGWLSANGNAALIAEAGGGAGGSIWVSARQLNGFGLVSANGGAGDLLAGGGGGGGRIALYARTNAFQGALTAFGAAGFAPGHDGTIVVSGLPGPQIIAQIPTGLVRSNVSTVTVTYDALMDSNTVAPADIVIETPNGPVPQASISVAPLSLGSFRISFPAQTTIGYYELHVGPQVQDIYGQAMSAAYVGSFVIWPPTISGRVTDATGQPVPYVSIYSSSDPMPVLTDTNGNYQIEVSPSWTGTITPVRGIQSFIPTARTYSNVTTDLAGQNFAAATTAALTVSGQRAGTNFLFSWFGINGVSYQVLSSTDLAHWTPYGAPIQGTGTNLSLLVPLSSNPQQFFRFLAQ
jgi:hypothetical protein